MRWACAECGSFVPVEQLTERPITRGHRAYVCEPCSCTIDALALTLVPVRDGRVIYEGDERREAERMAAIYGSEFD